MGRQQRNGDGTRPIIASRPERHEVNIYMTLPAKTWPADDDFASSQDGPWSRDEEYSDTVLHRTVSIYPRKIPTTPRNGPISRSGICTHSEPYNKMRAR